MKIMSLYAHPADHFSECGGTLAVHAQNGDDIVLVTITHGGRIHPNVYAQASRQKTGSPAGKDEIIAHKKQEMRRAADIIGVERLINLDFEDNYVGVEQEIVQAIAKVIADEQPDVILTDYPQNAAIPEVHTLATVMVFNALNQVSLYLRNLDGRDEYHVKQIYMTKLPVFTRDKLSLYGIQNDLYIDISHVVGLKIKALDQFSSQGYNGSYARKVIESVDGVSGKTAFVNFAEAFCRLYGETHSLLPITDYMLQRDILTAHTTYSTIDVRRQFPEDKTL